MYTFTYKYPYVICIYRYGKIHTKPILGPSGVHMRQIIPHLLTIRTLYVSGSVHDPALVAWQIPGTVGHNAPAVATKRLWAGAWFRWRGGWGWWNFPMEDLDFETLPRRWLISVGHHAYAVRRRLRTHVLSTAHASNRPTS